MEQSNSDTKFKEIINQKDIRIQQLEEQLLSIQQQNHTYICLKCNQLYTSIDIFNHLQQYKDHIDCCIHSDIIKNQLLEFNNNNSSSYSNNNIFKNRIDTIWSELERLSKSHYKLHKKKKEIGSHFEQLHNRLMIKEHSLKKQINDDIDLVSCDIINQINELKSITNIVNDNNINNNNNNNNKSEETYVDLSDSEDTQDNYSITTIIESIKQSKSYNQFISNNKNTLFYNNSNNNENDKEFITILNSINNYNKEFKSCLSNPNKVNTESFKLKIDKNKYIIKIDQYNRDQLDSLIDSSITVDISLPVLVRIGDFDGFKQYFKRNNIKAIDYTLYFQREFHELIIEILESNRIDILNYLINDLQLNINTYFHLWYDQINDFNRLPKKNILDLSVIYSNLETIKFIESLGIKNNIKWNYESALELSPLSNNMDILQYFSSKVLENSPDSIKKIFVSGNAAALGRTDMIEWISQNTPFVFTSEKRDKDGKLEKYYTAMDIAAENGHLETIKWLHENRTEGCTTDAMDYAAENGNFETIKWLHLNRTEGCTTNAMDKASGNGHFETVKWLHENRTEGCTANAMDKSSGNGHFETVKWLHEHRTEGCTTHAMDNAACSGYLEIIKWLHENRTEGCTTNAMDNAACSGYLEIIKWLQENRTEGCTTDAMDYAAENGNFETIKWLHENRTEGCTTAAMDNSAELNRLEMIKWLHENRTEGCTYIAMDAATYRGHFEIVKWLHYNRTEGCSVEAINSAAQDDFFEIFKFLYKNRTECNSFSEKELANERLLEWINNNKK